MVLLRLQDNRAFTLLELLFVLLIISLITFISIPAVYKMQINQQTKQFFTVFDADVLYVQNQALGQSNQIRIVFEKDYYSIINEDNETHRRVYPKHITYRSATTNRIVFNRLGTVREPGTFHFYIHDDTRYAVVFPLGKGRHYIEQR